MIIAAVIIPVVEVVLIAFFCRRQELIKRIKQRVGRSIVTLCLLNTGCCKILSKDRRKNNTLMVYRICDI